MGVFPERFPVVIVGAGPTGLTAANLLARYGVASLLIEKNPTPLDIPRAIVLDDFGARVLQAFGADKTYLPHAISGLGEKYYDDSGACFYQAGADEAVNGFASRTYISQPDLETALVGHAADSPLIDLRFDCEVQGLVQTDQGVTLDVVHGRGRVHRIEADCVLAADGGRSTLREVLDIKMVGSTYRQAWIVIDTLNDPDQSRISRFFCSTRRPHISLPSPNGGRRYEFMMRPQEDRETVLAPGFVRDLLAPFRKISKADILRQVIYTFHARMAERFGKGRVLLLGDAAHLTPPFTGQGMNSGLRDAANVAWKVAAVLNGGARSGVLASYEAERRSPVSATIRQATEMGDRVMPANPEAAVFHQHLLRRLGPFPEIRNHLMDVRFRPKHHYDGGLIARLDMAQVKGSLVGEVIPQPDVILDDNVTRPLDAMLGAGFALVAQNAAGAKALSSLDQGRIFGHELSKLYLVAQGAGDFSKADGGVQTVSFDPAGIGRALNAHHGHILLIRPDRFCAGAFLPDDLAQGLADMAARLGMPKGAPERRQ